jgi:hypothetical protein
MAPRHDGPSRERPPLQFFYPGEYPIGSRGYPSISIRPAPFVLPALPPTLQNNRTPLFPRPKYFGVGGCLPVLYNPGDHPSPVPVPKPVFRVESPSSGGGDPLPPLGMEGGGVSHGRGGGTPSVKKFPDAPHPPARFFLGRPPSPPTFRNRRGDYPPFYPVFTGTGSLPVPVVVTG